MSGSALRERTHGLRKGRKIHTIDMLHGADTSVAKKRLGASRRQPVSELPSSSGRTVVSPITRALLVNVYIPLVMVMTPI